MTAKITEPGVYKIPEAEYHADPVEGGSLRSSIAHTALTRSALHAKTELDASPVDKRQFDMGKAAHAIILEGEDNAVVLDVDSFNTKAARAARDAAYDAGKTPQKRSDWDDVRRMRDAFFEQIVRQEDGAAFLADDAESEYSVVWDDNGQMCRARYDRFSPAAGFIYDLKSAGGSAEPAAWTKTNMWTRPAFQAGFYCRGAMNLRLLPKRPTYRWLVQEIKPPYALTVCAMDPQGEEIADEMAARAIAYWSQCERANSFPGYPPVTAHVETPPWIHADWEARKYHAEILASRPDATAIERALAFYEPLNGGNNNEGESYGV